MINGILKTCNQAGTFLLPFSNFGITISLSMVTLLI